MSGFIGALISNSGTPAAPFYSIGSMVGGTATLTLSANIGGTDYQSGTPSVPRPFVNGDKVIVEIGGEAGAGLFGTMGVGGVVTATLSGSYYNSLDAPKSLLATILNVVGNVLTLDATAFTSTTNAKIYLDNSDAFNTEVTTPHAPGFTVTWPAGEFAISRYIGPMTITGWTIQGAGKGITILYTAKGTPNGGLIPNGSGFTIKDFTIIGNSGWNYFGLPNDGNRFSVGVGVWCASPVNAIVQNIACIDVWKKAVWFDAGTNCQIIDCDMTLNQPLLEYLAQWYFGASDATGCTTTRCTFTCPYLSPGFETFRSQGAQFTDCTTVNGSFASNSSGDWLLDNFIVVVEPNTWLDGGSFSRIDPFFDINSNISSTSALMLLGGIVRNLDFTLQGYTSSFGDCIRGININVDNPNILVDGGTMVFPNTSSNPAIVSGAQGVYTEGDNTIVQDMTIVGDNYQFPFEASVTFASTSITAGAVSNVTGFQLTMYSTIIALSSNHFTHVNYL